MTTDAEPDVPASAVPASEVVNEKRSGTAGAPSSAAAVSLATVVLGSMRWVALLTVLGALFARAIVPALHGIAVGYDRFTNRSQTAAEVTTQLVAVVLLGVSIALAVEVARSRAPIYLRALSIVLTGAVSMLVFASIQGERSFTPVLVVLSLSASTIVIAAGVDGLRQPAAGALGAVAILAGVSSSLRTLAVLLANRAALLPRTEGIDWARVFATASFAAEIMLIVVATGWVTTRSKKLTSPAVVVALLLAALGTREALLDTANPSPLFFLVKHGAARLLSRPVPFAPLGVEVFVALFAPLLATAVLLQRRQVPALLATLALLLLAGATAEIPVHAAALVVASLTMTLASRDARGVWAAIASAERARKG